MTALTAVASVLALGACTQKAPPDPTLAADTAYCNKLIALYAQVVTPERKADGKYEVSVAEAINQCQSGNPRAGIPTLEGKLREQRAVLPAR